MILVDTSVWIDHFRSANTTLGRLLVESRVLAHPFVICELALGAMGQRQAIVETLLDLPHSEVATDEEVLRFIDGAALHGSGIGYVDAHLLTSARLTLGSAIWTGDKRLGAAAERLSLAHRPGER